MGIDMNSIDHTREYHGAQITTNIDKNGKLYTQIKKNDPFKDKKLPSSVLKEINRDKHGFIA